MNFHDLDNYNLADAVKFHQRLNPSLWGRDEHLLPEVKEKLLSIAEFFQEFLGVDDLKVKDITVSGSNAAYSYTKNSDIDLHLVVDMPDDPVYQELFNAKKYEFNDTHNIKIAGVPVELYVQPSDQKHVSQGIYSVKNDDWVQVPQRRRASIDDSCVQHKTADLDARIHSAIKSGNADAVNQLWDKIKTMRQTGLEKNGEFGCENITFKLLRNMGCIGELKDAKTAIQDRELSLNPKPVARKKVNYGMRDYWYPGTAYAGQDHPAGTESEQVDESVELDHLKKILQRFYASCVDKLELENPPRLRLETTPDWSQENGSFGQYDSDTNTLILATTGRHVLDILRTMAHEMTHRQQDETNPLPIDAGETGSPWEDQANAMAGRIMRQWAEEQPEMFDGVTLEEASGYIPTKAQARDPRFVMALTRDVRPGAVGKEANKLGLKTDSQGHPALLTAGLNKLLREFKEQDLFEINMGGKSLRKEAAKTGAIAGMEFEMIVPGIDSDQSNDELEPDYDFDVRCRSIDDAVQFFHDGDFNRRREVQRLRERMENDFQEWLTVKIDQDWDSDGEDFVRDWVANNVDNSEWLDNVNDQTTEQEAFDEFASNVHADPKNDYYQSALDEYREDNYGNYAESDWLDAEGLGLMSNVEDAYEIQWPHWSNPNEGNSSVDTQMVADEFSQAVGREVRVNTRYHQSGERPGPKNQFYVVEPDGSLDGDNDGDEGLEFVSPPMPIDELLKDLNAVKAWAGRMGVYTNDSTGLHINISVPNYSIDQLDYVKLALLMGDEYVLDNFGRASNTYAKSAMSKIKGKITPENAKQILDTMKSGMNQLATKAIHSGYTDKYTSINTKDGHIEFRSPGGDWLDENFEKIENTLLRFTVAMSAALNPEAYRQEYLKKLYKMLAPKGDKDPLAIFAKYSAGELPKAALKSFVRQAQLERGNKAAKQAELDTMQKELTPAPGESNQGNWGVWVPSLDRYATIGNAGPRRFRDQAEAEAWIQDYNARNLGSELELIAQEIEPAAPAVNRNTLAPTGPGPWEVFRRSDGSSVAELGTTNRMAAEVEARGVIDQRREAPELYGVRTQQGADAAQGGIIDIEPDVAQNFAPQTLTRPGQGQQTFTGNWLVLDPDGQEMHRFSGVGNVQSDANRVAINWLRSNPGRMQAGVSVVPEMSVAASQQQYQYTSTPIPGVEEVELDIPMAQTQWEVYNRSSNQPVFVIQAANQTEAWRKGQEWVATAMQANPEVDASNFSVRPRAQSVSENITMLEQRLRRDLGESREITKLGKLDNVLEKCINMIHRGHESDPEKYGRVAACLIDNKNNHTYGINLPGPDGSRRHAERVAIDNHLKRHGRIGSNAIMVTTLSPCVHDMDERYGESCTDLLADFGIEKCYAGWQDPTQHPTTDYPFNLQVTDNADIFNTCQHIAASFLPQVMANNLNETINPDVFNPAFNDTQIFDGLTYRATGIEINGKEYFQVKVLDDNYQQIGLAKFRPSKNGLVSAVTSLKPEYQGRGIARNIYAYVRMLGNTIVPSRNQLPPGKAMWDAWKKSGDAKHLMKDVAEEEEPIRIKLGNNDAAQAWIEKVYAAYPHTMQNNHVMVWGSGNDQQFAMFELVPSFSKRGAVEVKWIQAYPLRQGVGSRAMQELQAMAREDGISLTLFPWDKGQVSQSKLTKFYRGQGFKPTVKGGKAMQWEPK